MDPNNISRLLTVLQPYLAQIFSEFCKTGWIAAGETWTYASATTFTISGDYTGKYVKGDKIKLTQTSTKYFYIVSSVYSSPNTTITVTGGSDYSLANAAITSPYYSKAETPVGFPNFFNWTPSFTGFSANPAGGIYRFAIRGNIAFLKIYMPNTGTSNQTFFTLTAPCNSVNNSGEQTATGVPVVDSGTTLTSPGLLYIAANSNSLVVNKTLAGGGWTASGGKRLINADFFYEI